MRSNPSVATRTALGKTRARLLAVTAFVLGLALGAALVWARLSGQDRPDDLALMCDAVQSAEMTVPALVDTNAAIEVGWSVDAHAMWLLASVADLAQVVDAGDAVEGEDGELHDAAETLQMALEQHDGDDVRQAFTAVKARC